MTLTYTCPKPECPFVREMAHVSRDEMQEIFAHEREHEKNKKTTMKTEKVPCKHCDGNGYTLETFEVDVDVSETDSGRD